MGWGRIFVPVLLPCTRTVVRGGGGGGGVPVLLPCTRTVVRGGGAEGALRVAGSQPGADRDAH